MNVIDMLSKEMSKENWNIEEKIRYIYIFVVVNYFVMIKDIIFMVYVQMQ